MGGFLLVGGGGIIRSGGSKGHAGSSSDKGGEGKENLNFDKFGRV